ncbi:hypothetical protein FRB97_007049 [Tulasnella sp. 331]|nr:hypothetical protein FRB97_007049 [Tulasnella sp. 331]
MKFATQSHPTSPTNAFSTFTLSPSASTTSLYHQQSPGLDAPPSTPTSPLASLIPTFLRRASAQPASRNGQVQRRASKSRGSLSRASSPPPPQSVQDSPSSTEEGFGLLDDDPFASALSTPATTTWSPASTRYAFEASSSTGHCHALTGSASVPVSPTPTKQLDIDSDVTPLHRRNRALTTLNVHPRNQQWQSERPVVRKRPSLPTLTILAQQNVVVPVPKSSRARQFPREPWDKDPSELEATLPKLSPIRASPDSSHSFPKPQAEASFGAPSLQTQHTITEEDEENCSDGGDQKINEHPVEVEEQKPDGIIPTTKAIPNEATPILLEAPIETDTLILHPEVASSDSTLTSTSVHPHESVDAAAEVSSKVATLPLDVNTNTSSSSSTVAIDIDKPLPDVPNVSAAQTPVAAETHTRFPTDHLTVPRETLTVSVAIAISQHGDMSFPSSYPPPESQLSTSPAPSSCLMHSPNSEASMLPDLVFQTTPGRTSDDTITTSTEATTTEDEACEFEAEEAGKTISMIGAETYSAFWNAARDIGGENEDEENARIDQDTYNDVSEQDEQREEEGRQPKLEANAPLAPSKRSFSLSALFGGSSSASSSGTPTPERQFSYSAPRMHSHSHANSGGSGKDYPRYYIGGGGRGDERSSRNGAGSGSNSRRSGASGGGAGGSGNGGAGGDDGRRGNSGDGPWRSSHEGETDEEEEDENEDGEGRPRRHRSQSHRLRVPRPSSRERPASGGSSRNMPPVPPLPYHYKSQPSWGGTTISTQLSSTHSRSGSGQTNATTNTNASSSRVAAPRTRASSESQEESGSDDVPLAQRIPSALVAQKSIRKQARDDKLRAGKVSESAMQGRSSGVGADELMNKLQRLQVEKASSPRPSIDFNPPRRSEPSEERTLRPSRSLHRLHSSPATPSAVRSNQPYDPFASGMAVTSRAKREQSLGPRNERPTPLELSTGRPPSKAHSRSRPASPQRSPGHDGSFLLPPLPRSANPSHGGGSDGTPSQPTSRDTSNAGWSQPMAIAAVGNETVPSSTVRRARTTKEGLRQQIEESVPLARLAPGPGPGTSSASRTPAASPGPPGSPTLPSAPRLRAGDAAQPAQNPMQFHQHRIFIEDGQRFTNIDISAETTAEDVLEQMVAKGDLPAGHVGFMLWEITNEFGMQRPIRDFELLSDVFTSWNPETRVNVLMAKTTPKTLCTALSRGAVPMRAPSAGGYIHWEAKKGKWSKRWLELRDQSLYLGKKEHGKDGAFMCTLSTFDAYLVKRIHKAPRPFVFAVKSTDNISLFENPADCVHIFSCDVEDGESWFQNLLLARSSALHRERTILFRSQPVVSEMSDAPRRSTTRRPTAKPLLSDMSPSLPQHGFQTSTTAAADGSLFAAGSLLSRTTPNAAF